MKRERILGSDMRIAHRERSGAPMKKISEVEKLAKSGKWNFDHVVFYLQKILCLPPAEVNRLVDAWNL